VFIIAGVTFPLLKQSDHTVRLWDVGFYETLKAFYGTVLCPRVSVPTDFRQRGFFQVHPPVLFCALFPDFSEQV
jgi:hypothetical protein